MSSPSRPRSILDPRPLPTHTRSCGYPEPSRRAWRAPLHPAIPNQEGKAPSDVSCERSTVRYRSIVGRSSGSPIQQRILRPRPLRTPRCLTLQVSLSRRPRRRLRYGGRDAGSRRVIGLAQSRRWFAAGLRAAHRTGVARRSSAPGTRMPTRPSARHLSRARSRARLHSA